MDAFGRDIQSEIFFKNMLTQLALFGLGIFLPAVILLFVSWTGWSEFVEEIVKGLVVVFLVTRLSSNVRKLIWSVIFGLCFGVSESFFFLSNIVETGKASDFWWRFITAVPLHAVTSLLVIAPIIIFKSKKAGVVGIALAIIFHLLFNHTIATMVLFGK